jgi:16S rRNA (guanine966-N2)-methyltransferase
MFSSLESLRGPFSGARVLDLYAGSGALGLEARSRGAVVVDLVESDRGAARVIEENIVAVFGEPDGVATGVAAHHTTVDRWLRGLPDGSVYDVVFLDPPYLTPTSAVAEVLDVLARQHLAAAGFAVVERSSRDDRWEWSALYEQLRDVTYGEARIGIARLG